MKTWNEINDKMTEKLNRLHFSRPVEFVYNPLDYAREAYDQYIDLFGKGSKEILFLGMNPGPWGMVQTGIPFGEVDFVTKWMKISSGVTQPKKQHPKRKILGFDCNRHEVSGKRVWQWISSKYQTPQKFAEKYFIANYSPLAFMEEGGKNRTPDKLKKNEREKLFEICDEVLRDTVKLLSPKWVIGIGKFAEKRATFALKGISINIGVIAHPSPANPAANRGWEPLVESELSKYGLEI